MSVPGSGKKKICREKAMRKSMGLRLLIPGFKVHMVLRSDS